MLSGGSKKLEKTGNRARTVKLFKPARTVGSTLG
jgi:hypothetical protein